MDGCRVTLCAVPAPEALPASSRAEPARGEGGSQPPANDKAAPARAGGAAVTQRSKKRRVSLSVVAPARLRSTPVVSCLIID